MSQKPPSKTSDSFWLLRLPDGTEAPIPADIQVIIPQTDAVPSPLRGSLAYIPWDDKYLRHVPAEYRDFFSFVVPFLNARTTDVHTALSVSYVPELIQTTPQAVDEKVLHTAVILHDAGWGQLAEHEIAASLNYSGVAYSEAALQPKERHATLGAEMARKLLSEYEADLGFTETHHAFIADLVHYHDQIRPWPTDHPNGVPMEYLLLGDADRLWSYTHENFWLDTIRKGVPARQYAHNLAVALDEYFLTNQGRAIAWGLMAERQTEVAQLP
jgi:hypothetical protein